MCRKADSKTNVLLNARLFFFTSCFVFCNPLRSGKCLSVRVFCCRYDKIARLRRRSARTTKKKYFFFEKLFILHRQKAHGQIVYHGMCYVMILCELQLRNVHFIFLSVHFCKAKREKHRLFLSQRHAFIMICRRRADLLAYCYTNVYSSK